MKRKMSIAHTHTHNQAFILAFCEHS